MEHCIHEDSQPVTAFARGPLVFLVGDDWRVLRFIRTELRYATTASVIEAVSPYAALTMARKMARPIDLLILQIELSDANMLHDLARGMAGHDKSLKVLWITSRGCPRCNTPAGWRLLSIPFTTEALLNSINGHNIP
jgi:hypothetical protein